MKVKASTKFSGQHAIDDQVIRMASPLAPAPGRAKPQTEVLTQPEFEPPYHVILYDDDEHTYAYVIEMLKAIFGYSFQKAYLMADAVNNEGRVIVATSHKELAELRLEQIQEFGPDPRSENCKGSMTASIEPAE